MPALARQRLTVEEFLVSAEERDGRWELQDGVLIAMAPERVSHLRAKSRAVNALADAIQRAGAPCEALPDGAVVRISARTVFEPDATV